MRILRRPTLALLLVLSAAAPAGAHEVPGDVTLQMHVRPRGERLSVLVRAPLEAMQEIPLPTFESESLDLARARASGALRSAAMLWIAENVELYEDGRPLPRLEIAAIQVSLPSDRSFVAWESALAHVTGEPLPETTLIPWRQAMLDVLFETPIGSDRSELAIHPHFERMALRVVTVLRFHPPDGAERAFELRGDPGLVRLDPRWHQAAGRFVELGFVHILGGADHLLFLACLVIPLRRLRQLVLVATSFTVAHSVTLIASAYGFVPDALWFPALVELLIAASIVYMALENILGVNVERRWAITFAFGLVHGFGFSFALRETLQFAGSHLLTSLLSFNVGVELGQVLVLVLLVPLLDLVFRRAVAERMGAIVLSALVAHTAWHWLVERSAAFAQYEVAAPLRDALPEGSLSWLAVAVILLALVPRTLRTGRLRGAVPGRGEPAAVAAASRSSGAGSSRAEIQRSAPEAGASAATASPTLRPPIHTE